MSLSHSAPWHPGAYYDGIMRPRTKFQTCVWGSWCRLGLQAVASTTGQGKCPHPSPVTPCPLRQVTAHCMRVLRFRAPGLLLDTVSTTVWLWTSHLPFLSLNFLLSKTLKSFVLKDLTSNPCSFFLSFCSLGSWSSCLLVSETVICVQSHYLETPPCLVR